MDEVPVKDLDPEQQKIACKHFAEHRQGYVLVGAPGREYTMPIKYGAHATAVRRMRVLPDDLWVSSYPRSGTTCIQEMVWLLNNDLDFKEAQKVSLTQRYIFLENFSLIGDESKRVLSVDDETAKLLKKYSVIGYRLAENLPCRRYFKTHLPLSLLPPNLLDTARVVYIARDPRDVAVSYYHHNRLFKWHAYSGSFKNYWNLFINDLLSWTPYFNHLKEAWAQRRHPHMQFLFYEDINKDLLGTVRLLSGFLGKNYEEHQLEELFEHLQFDNMKKNAAVLPEVAVHPALANSDMEAFIRKGKSGNWRDYFDEEMTVQAEAWIKENLEDTDIRFPESY